MKNALIFVITAALMQIAVAYQFFQSRLPNGNFVPHPCKPNYTWKGAGHENVLGGGPRNPFGRDFAENGFKWDECLCKQDSDGDGRTNGVELGDPDCTWSTGQAPKHKFGLSHPGVCEPLDSHQCREKNTFEIDCSLDEEFECEAIQSPDVENITVRFPATNVPAKETTYTCMTFDLPDDEDYHMIAYDPIINNPNVMHHILVFGCHNDTMSPLRKMPTPTECGMVQQSCQDVIALWSVGGYGVCLPEEFGFLIGKNGFKTIMMQMHWTNPEERTDYIDSSGLVLHYTPILRNNSAEILQTGQYYLQIPPGRAEFHQDGRCNSECTSRLPHSVYISETFFHMHYLGQSGYTELWRDGAKVMDLVKTDDYDYDRPEPVRYTTPVELKPGDSLHTRCSYNSLNRKKVTFYGEGSYDEMCISFITMYPAVGLKSCSSFAGNEFCFGDDEFNVRQESNVTTANRTVDRSPDPCSIFFTSPDLESNYINLFANCDENGAECLPNCQQAIDVFRASPCFQEPRAFEIETYLSRDDEDERSRNLRYYLRSCDTYDNDYGEAEDDDDGSRAEQGVVGRERYDPDRNGLPRHGVCPFSSASKPDGIGFARFDQLVIAVIVMHLNL